MLVTNPNPPTTGDTLRSALLASVPIVGGPLQVLFEHTAQRQAAATGEVMHDLAEQVGRELFERSIDASPELRALFLRAWEGACRTGLEKKRWLFGRIVKQALDHPAEFNDAWLKLQALEQLDAPHIEALERLARLYEAHARWDVQDLAGKNIFGKLTEAYRALWESFPAPVSATLAWAGVAQPAPTSYVAGARFPLLTEFGRGLLQEYRAMPDHTIVPAADLNSPPQR